MSLLLNTIKSAWLYNRKKKKRKKGDNKIICIGSCARFDKNLIIKNQILKLKKYFITISTFITIIIHKTNSDLNKIKFICC